MTTEELSSARKYFEWHTTYGRFSLSDEQEEAYHTAIRAIDVAVAGMKLTQKFKEEQRDWERRNKKIKS